MGRKIKFWCFRHSFVVLVPVLVVAGIGVWLNMLPLVGSALAFFYFFHRQKLAETRLMKELVTEFNGRYDDLNDQLHAIVAHPSLALIPCHKNTLIDYFNLCAEEHLFNDFGYVEPRVWQAWCNGMKEYAQDPRIGAYWKEELEKQSYYDFEFPTLEK